MNETITTAIGMSRRRFLTGAAAAGGVLGVSALLPLTGWSGGVALAEEIHYETTTLAIHGAHGPSRLKVELAESPQQRANGLMGREHLAPGAGMLFLYSRPQSPDSGFWMYRTLIPLDIAFIDSQGRIAAIRQMPPCNSEAPGECRAYRAGVTYLAALEVNAGYFAERGIKVGDCVSLPAQAKHLADEHLHEQCRP
ncbi:DUF192 domain-containing protein [Halomonas salinarum]|uniref:DUF192 domain-containing protein n=1 Tax=Halomonas salinarum TaxID=1158993 RepID=UPI001FD7CB76|nr:DUF192 domain-containing protein [Halomonas salinarum]